MLGGGKYNEAVTALREAVGLGGEAAPTHGGGVIVIVIGGEKGPSMEVQADILTTMKLPGLLRHLATLIERQPVQHEMTDTDANLH